MVGVHVRFENPLDLETALVDPLEHLISACGARATGCLIEIQDRVDNGGSLLLGVGDDVGDGERSFVEKRAYFGFVHYNQP